MKREGLFKSIDSGKVGSPTTSRGEREERGSWTHGSHPSSQRKTETKNKGEKV